MQGMYELLYCDGNGWPALNASICISAGFVPAIERMHGLKAVGERLGHQSILVPVKLWWIQ